MISVNQERIHIALVIYASNKESKMTVKELGKILLECDNDTLEFEVGVIVASQLSDGVRLSVRCQGIQVQENVDVNNKVLWLKGRTII